MSLVITIGSTSSTSYLERLSLELEELNRRDCKRAVEGRTTTKNWNTPAVGEDPASCSK
jgi:hypothetical protein